MLEFRWKLWVLASWITWWLCPDKKTYALIQKHGTITSRAALDALKRGQP